MTLDRQHRVATGGAAVGLVAIVLCAFVLIADYAAARARAAGEAARIEELQAQAHSDTSAARTLEAEQDRITRARLARRARIDALAFPLIAASVAFIASAKWRIALGRRRPVPPEPLRTRNLTRLSQVSGSASDLVRQASRPASLSLGRMRIPLVPVSATPSIERDAAVAAAPETIDLAFVDRTVREAGTSREAAIPILIAIQSHYRYLPDEALRRVCELTEITPAQIAGTSSFYSRFRRSPAGEHVVRVCQGTACHVSGARQITEELRRQLGIPDGADTDPARTFTLDEVACLGCCSLAPVLMVDDHTAGRLTPATALDALDAARQQVSA